MAQERRVDSVARARVRQRTPTRELLKPDELRLSKRRRTQRISRKDDGAVSEQKVMDSRSVQAVPPVAEVSHKYIDLLRAQDLVWGAERPAVPSLDIFEPVPTGPYDAPLTFDWRAVPRVVSSAHMNELVAKYSAPASEQSMLSPRASQFGLLSQDSPVLSTVDLYRPYGVVPAVLPIPSGLSGLRFASSADVSQGQGGSSSWTATAGSVFEDLATLAANAEIESRAGEDGGLEAEAAGEDTGGPAEVESMAMEDETRQAVERWLRDSPEVQGPEDDIQCPGVEDDEKERSLPQWVLEELGESLKAEDAGDVSFAPAQKLVRVDSVGSSTNETRGRLRGTSEEPCVYTSGNEERFMDTYGVHGYDDKLLQSMLRGSEEKPEVSTFSSPEGPALVEDDCLPHEAQSNDAAAHMTRSFSTTWMKDLLEDADLFNSELKGLQPTGFLPPAEVMGSNDEVGAMWIPSCTP